LKVKLLAEGEYQIVGIMEGDSCPAEDFLTVGDATTAAARMGLVQMLDVLAESGWQNVPAKWSHEASKQLQILEFIKGPLRLFFFKGQGRQIAVCTGGVRKTGAKANKAAVKHASERRKIYFDAVESNQLEVVDEEA
jgi:hypothetical protein